MTPSPVSRRFCAVKERAPMPRSAVWLSQKTDDRRQTTDDIGDVLVSPSRSTVLKGPTGVPGERMAGLMNVCVGMGFYRRDGLVGASVASSLPAP